MNDYKYLISIDPAGIGSSGVIVIDLNTWRIVFKETYKSESVTDAKNYFINLFANLKFKTKIFVWVEDFYLNKRITNPLATAKLIGALQVIVEDLFNWKFATYHPNKKVLIKEHYKGNMKLTSHEKDAYKGAKLFELEVINGKKSLKNHS